MAKKYVVVTRAIEETPKMAAEKPRKPFYDESEIAEAIDHLKHAESIAPEGTRAVLIELTDADDPSEAPTPKEVKVSEVKPNGRG